MSPLVWLQNLCSNGQPKKKAELILTLKEQINAWRKANRKMGWGIAPEEFDMFETVPGLSDEDRINGFIGTALFYGFGDDGMGHANAVFSGQQAWEYACKIRKGRTWRCEYVDFSKPEDIRLRPGAPLRPRGFYLAGVQPGERYINMTVSQLRKKLGTVTGWGPEGFQLRIRKLAANENEKMRVKPNEEHYLSKSHPQTLQPDRLSL